MLLPEPSEVREHADEAMAAAAVLRPGPDVFDALCRVLAPELSDTGLVDARLTIDRLKAHLDARQAHLLTELVSKRHVTIEHVDDGMSWLNLFLPRDGAEIVWTAIAARAVKTDPADERTADQQ